MELNDVRKAIVFPNGKVVELMRKKGFTLIEMIVIISVVGVLILLAISNNRRALTSSNIVRIESNVKNIHDRIQESIVNGDSSYFGRNIIPTEKSYIANECSVYNTKGELSQQDVSAIKDSKLKKIDDDYVRRSGVKDNGLFFANESGEIFYCKQNIEEMNNIKSGTILPYALWDTETVIETIDTMGLNTVNLSIRADTSSILAKDMKVNKDDLAHAVNLVKVIDDENINIMLEPFLWIDEGGIGEVELDPENVDLWFYQWRNDVLIPIMKHFERNGVTIDYYTVASNYVNLEYAHGYWEDTFKAMKKHPPKIASQFLRSVFLFE